MKTFKDNLTTMTQTKNAKGFTLIELLTVVAIIAILIGLLLPAIQRKREEVAAGEASAQVQQATNAADYYRNRTGQFPQSLALLVQFVTSNPSPGISIDPRLASGKANGYLYGIVEADQDHCQIEAEPEFPGITGSQTVTATKHTLEDAIIVSVATPGSDEARGQMFNKIRVKASETVLKLLHPSFFFDIPAEIQARSFVDQATESTDWIFVQTVMDRDGDGRITIDEIRNYDDPNMDSALKGPLSEFMDYTDDACMYSLLSEASSAFAAVSDGSIELVRPDQAPLFSYDGLCVLTRTMIFSDGLGVSNIMCEKLEAAEAAEASGDLKARGKAVKSYKKLVKAEIGRSITRGNANTLMGLLDVLTAQPPSVP